MTVASIALRFALFAALCGPPAAAAQPTEPAPPIDSMAERTRTCTACHGKEGRATREGYFPRIAGKPAGYLYNQLVNFRDARRANASMTYLVQHLSDDYLREIARYFGTLELPYPAALASSMAPEAAARGEALALRGDEARRIPACVQCHGQALTGVLPAMPGLLGLPRDYVAGQFGAWRVGNRRTPSPDCMAQITQRMSTEDVSAVATWLASQPLPVNSKPAVSIALPLPMPCGSGLEGEAQ